jgi:hypothetical protein
VRLSGVVPGATPNKTLSHSNGRGQGEGRFLRVAGATPHKTLSHSDGRGQGEGRFLRGRVAGALRFAEAPEPWLLGHEWRQKNLNRRAIEESPLRLTIGLPLEPEAEPTRGLPPGGGPPPPSRQRWAWHASRSVDTLCGSHSYLW